MRNKKKVDPIPIKNEEHGAPASSIQGSHPNENWQRYVEGPIIRFRELLSITKVGRSKAYLLMSPKSSEFDPDFPAGFPLFDSTRSPKGFWRAEAMAWLEGRSKKFRSQKKDN